MPKWYEREAPLTRCPLIQCRRSGTCLHSTQEDACRRHFMTQDEFYTKLAFKIDRILKEIIANRPPGKKVKVAEPGTPLFERRLKLLYDSLRARDDAECAAQLAARRTGTEKPADAPGDA
jgi:hypothetical protein